MLTIIISKWEGLATYYIFMILPKYVIYTMQMNDIVCIELHKVYMKNHISSHGIYSYLLLPFSKQVFSLINTDSLLFYSNETKMQIVWSLWHRGRTYDSEKSSNGMNYSVS